VAHFIIPLATNVAKKKKQLLLLNLKDNLEMEKGMSEHDQRN